MQSLDELTLGWHPGELTLIAGRPGAGKTMLGLEFARRALESGRRVCRSFPWKCGPKS